MSEEILRRKLSEETTWRCGACSTPEIGNARFEMAHINPSCNGGSDDYENKILLCQRCHTEYDSHIIRGNKLNTNTGEAQLWIDKLRAHKRQWMEVSGKYSKLELDCLFDLYKSYTGGAKAEEWIESYKQVPLFLEYPHSDIIKYAFNLSGENKTHFITITGQAGYFHRGAELYGIKVQKIYLYSFRNLIKNNLVAKLDSPQGNVIGRIVEACDIFLTDDGVNFCRRFFQ